MNENDIKLGFGLIYIDENDKMLFLQDQKTIRQKLRS